MQFANAAETAARAGGAVAKGAAPAGDHIVLGLEKWGLRDTAAKVGGRHIMDDRDFMNTVIRGAKDPNTRFTVSLDGMSGATTREQVSRAVEDGMRYGSDNSFTNWELATLSRNGRLPDTTFIRGGSTVPNPFTP